MDVVADNICFLVDFRVFFIKKVLKKYTLCSGDSNSFVYMTVCENEAANFDSKDKIRSTQPENA